MDQIYSAADIVGKTLYGQSPIQIKRLPADSATVVYTAGTGQALGVVYSYLLPGPDRKSLYWMFKDSGGKPYYSAHAPGAYSLSALKSQGVLTVKEKAQELEKANESTGDKIIGGVKTVALIIGAAIVLKALLPDLLKGKK